MITGYIKLCGFFMVARGQRVMFGGVLVVVRCLH